MICVNCFLVRRAPNSSNAHRAAKRVASADLLRREFLVPFDNLRGEASVSFPVPMLGRMTSSAEVTEEVA